MWTAGTPCRSAPSSTLLLPTTQYRRRVHPRLRHWVDAKQNAYTGRSARAWRVIYEKDGTLVEKDLGSAYGCAPPPSSTILLTAIPPPG